MAFSNRFQLFLAAAIVVLLSREVVSINRVPTTPDWLCLPNPPAWTAHQLSLPYSTCEDDVKWTIGRRHPDQNLHMGEFLEKYNYPYEIHTVTTEDGYILNTYRITGSPHHQGSAGGKKEAVFIQHGIAAASDCWNFQPGSRSLPFKLADAGYEVWLGNARGTTYSTGHTSLNASKDLDYWDFSWHEMGMYDIPAVIDKVIEVSGNEKIFYVAHSMGSTMYMVSLSSIPEMNDKIKAGFMLAPIAYMGHANIAMRYAMPLMNTDPMFQIANKLMKGRVESAEQFRLEFKLSMGDVCDLTAMKCGVCDNLVFMLFGYDAPQMNNTELPHLLAKFPNTMSMKTLAHFAQIGTTCKFRQYDFGPWKNRKVYGSLTPPEYPLENIKAPTYFYHGEHDNLGPPNDVHITASKFSPGVLKEVHRVEHDYWNHVDFVAGKDADVLVYNRILNEMNSLSGNQHEASPEQKESVERKRDSHKF